MRVLYEKKGHVAHITLNNPEKANILDRPTAEELSEVWKETWEDMDVRVAILTAVGQRHFCAGHNLAVRPDITAEERERARTEAIFWPLAGSVNGAARFGADGRLGRPLPPDLEAGHRRDQWLGGRSRLLPDVDFDRYTHRM